MLFEIVVRKNVRISFQFVRKKPRSLLWAFFAFYGLLLPLCTLTNYVIILYIENKNGDVSFILLIVCRVHYTVHFVDYIMCDGRLAKVLRNK